MSIGAKQLSELAEGDYKLLAEKAYQQAKGLYMEAAEKINTILEGILNLNKSEENPQNGKNSQ